MTHVPLSEHVADLVLLLGSGRRPNRSQLASRWGCCERNVSAIIARARTVFGVKLASRRKRDGTHGYTLASTGIIHMESLRQKRRARAQA